MSDQTPDGAQHSGQGNDQAPDQQMGQPSGFVVVGPDGQPVGAMPIEAKSDQEGGVGDLVEQPAKVMRIGSMIRQLLDEVKSAPVDEPGRRRLAQVLHSSIAELKDGLAPELDEELERLVQPFEAGQTPSESELRIAQAQLVGWLEGLFHGIQTAIYAQQMVARAQLEQMRRALPPGPGDPSAPGSAEDGPHAGGQGGMYL